MSLSVNHLTKTFGNQNAVQDLSFTVESGEVVGFLGPNGAGKSTTMKIATTFIPPTSGQVTVNGFDVMTHPLEVRKVIGYLPEHNPLYLDMYVHEYLNFVCRLFDIPHKKREKRIGEMIEMCGLTREQNKRIESLSKGYRQRVGLAQALIHDPSVLILDEPTTGLDPNQIIEIRNLIKQISRQKTVIFSTHIMQEVQAICDRVIVINQGEIVADDQLDNLMSRERGVSVVVEFDEPVKLDSLYTIEGVQSITEMGVNKFKVVSKGEVDLRARIFQFATENKLSLIGLKQEEGSLENIFRELTQSSVKDLNK